MDPNPYQSPETSPDELRDRQAVKSYVTMSLWILAALTLVGALLALQFGNWWGIVRETHIHSSYTEWDDDADPNSKQPVSENGQRSP